MELLLLFSGVRGDTPQDYSLLGGDSLGLRTVAVVVASTLCTQEEKKKERKNNAAAFTGIGFWTSV